MASVDFLRAFFGAHRGAHGERISIIHQHMLRRRSTTPLTARRRAEGLLFVAAAVAITVCASPTAATYDPPGALATCADGRTMEKLTCDNTLKVTKCFDAKVTCRKWDVAMCCSAKSLHKCLNPLAGRAFDTDCSSPIDAREECCADPTTHERAFRTPPPSICARLVACSPT